jgi:hypothetical protein
MTTGVLLLLLALVLLDVGAAAALIYRRGRARRQRDALTAEERDRPSADRAGKSGRAEGRGMVRLCFSCGRAIPRGQGVEITRQERPAAGAAPTTVTVWL